MHSQHRGVEQSVARRAHNPEVAGSSPASATKQDKSQDLSCFFIYLQIRVLMSKQECIQGFSDYIFWDVERNSIDLASNAPFVIQRVLEYGQIGDWKLLLGYYGLEEIVKVTKQLRTLEPRALAFISTVSQTPVEQFRCYNTRQSNPEHCNF